MIYTRPIKEKRVLMIAPDVVIDRRILIEAETLIDEGYEVYLLAGWDTSIKDLFEMDGRVRIERIKYEGLDPRMSLLYKAQAWSISQLNRISAFINKKMGSTSLKGTNFIANMSNNSIGLLNKFSLFNQKVFANLSLKTAKYLIVNKLVVITLKIVLKGISVSAIVSNKLHSFTIRFYQAPLYISLKGVNYLINLIARGVNFKVNVMVRVIPRIVGLNAYEAAYIKRALFYRPDIIHIHDLPMLKIGVKVKKKLGVPLIYDMHEFYPEQPRLTPQQQKYLRHLEKKYVHDADRVITVNFKLGEVIQNTYNLKRIDIIQNSIVTSGDFSPEQSYDRFREDYPELKDRLLLLYQGWIAPERNLENIIKGMSLVKNNKWTLLIMGYGDYVDELQKLVEDTRLIGRVVFVPAKPQSTLLTYSASADLGLIPYPYGKDLNTHFVSPNKLYEFINAGLPIMTNNLPYVQYVVEENGFGIVADLNSPEKFAGAVDEINIETLVGFKNNLKRNSWKYSWEEEEKSLLGIYEQLGGKHLEKD